MVGEDAEEGQAANRGGGVALQHQSQNEARAEPEGGVGAVKVLLGCGHGGWPLLPALLPLDADFLGRLPLEEVTDDLSGQVPCHPSTVALLGGRGAVDKVVGGDNGGGGEEAGKEERGALEEGMGVAVFVGGEEQGGQQEGAPHPALGPRPQAAHHGGRGDVSCGGLV